MNLSRRMAVVPAFFILLVLAFSTLAYGSCDAALLVIDVQKTFLAGVEWNTVDGVDIVDAVAEVLASAREAGVPVIYIKDHTVLLFESVAEPMLEFADAIAPLEGDPVFIKTSPNAFFARAFTEYVAEREFTRLIFCGLASEGCVASTLLFAIDRRYEVTVVADAHSNGPDPLEDRPTAADFNAEWAERGAIVLPMDEIDGLRSPAPTRRHDRSTHVPDAHAA